MYRRLMFAAAVVPSLLSSTNAADAHRITDNSQKSLETSFDAACQDLPYKYKFLPTINPNHTAHFIDCSRGIKYTYNCQETFMAYMYTYESNILALKQNSQEYADALKLHCI